MFEASFVSHSASREFPPTGFVGNWRGWKGASVAGRELKGFGCGVLAIRGRVEHGRRRTTEYYLQSATFILTFVWNLRRELLLPRHVTQ